MRVDVVVAADVIGSLNLYDCRFEGNSGVSASGGDPSVAYVPNASPTMVFDRCEFIKNVDDMFVIHWGTDSRPQISIYNSLIADNTEASDAIFRMHEKGWYECRNVTFANNNYKYVVERSGGVSLRIDMYNSILAHNSNFGVYGGTSPTLYDSLVHDSGSMTYNIGAGAQVWTFDPELVDPSANGDYRLSKASQAIDIGDNDYVKPDTDPLDLDREKRIVNFTDTPEDTVDLGAYEQQRPKGTVLLLW